MTRRTTSIDASPPLIARALARQDVQAVIRKWRGASFRVRCLGHTRPDHYFAFGEIVYGNGTVEQAGHGLPTPRSLAAALPRAAERPTVCAALEGEIARDLRRVRNQMYRATRRQDLRRDALARSCWREIEAAVRLLLESDDTEPLKERLASLVDRLVVEGVMTS